MVSKIITLIFLILLVSLDLVSGKAETWIKAGYYMPQTEFPVSDIDSSFFTHLVYCCAQLNSTSYQLFFLPDDEKYWSTFTETVKKKNPLVTTLLSIGGQLANNSTFSSILSSSSYRKSFIDSSITTARDYGFGGLDFYWLYPNTTSDMLNLPKLFEEWQAAVNLDSINSRKSQLILTTVVLASPAVYPIERVQHYINWSHLITVDYVQNFSFTSAPSALHGPTGIMNTYEYIKRWIDGGLSANKLVICLPYYGHAWQLVNATDNGFGAPATGPAFTEDGSLRYNEIKKYIKLHGGNVMYNSTYVVNYWTVGTSWIVFDDVEAIRAKVLYARENGLRGYSVWRVSFDFNWMLSQTAALVNAPIISPAHAPAQEDNKNKQQYLFLVIILPATASVMLLLGFLTYFRWIRKLKSKGGVDSIEESRRQVKNAAAAAGDFNGNVPNLVLYSLADIEAATDNFSVENKLGQGGYGPVYKTLLKNITWIGKNALISLKGFVKGFYISKNTQG